MECGQAVPDWAQHLALALVAIAGTLAGVVARRRHR